MYDHFILNRNDNDYHSNKSEDSEETVTSDPSLANIKPRKTKFVPQSYYSCQFCGKWYRSRTSLGLHRRLECGKEPAFQCPYCPLKTHQKGNLQVHIKKKHSSSEGQSLKSKNPILAQELCIPSLNAQQLGINREISSELTITRTQPPRNSYSRTPNLSHILSQPNKARGITQFPLTVEEINNGLGSSNEQNKLKVRGLANIPPGIQVTHKRPIRERLPSDITITQNVKEPPKNIKHSETNYDLSPNRSEGTNCLLDTKKLPELTRILNSQEPVPPVPVILDSFSIPSTSKTVKEEPTSPTKDTAPERIPDSTDKETDE